MAKGRLHPGGLEAATRLAEHAQASVGSVASWLAQQTRPSLMTLFHVANALEVALDELAASLRHASLPVTQDPCVHSRLELLGFEPHADGSQPALCVDCGSSVVLAVAPCRPGVIVTGADVPPSGTGRRRLTRPARFSRPIRPRP